ncbi:acyl-CoA dehydrogenase C-terminal domain-containing protein [Colwellia sp. D2M02]|uniref:acyl-CoA dehydrogenase C-terminal domain-containing protein n=1 Tax=Colwellia sp. D2M02 TaxID=2841562 RepID=UPI001C08EF4B|nr:acyl-CoA dehydrogenase C-terminal domain-containing protein [Colwellia sp. D2M02]
MTEYKVPLNDMDFLLYDVFNVDEVWRSLPQLAEQLDKDVAGAILQECAKIAEQAIAPISREGDEEGVSFKLNDNGIGGKVTTAKGYKEAFATYAEGGWCGLGGDVEYGGMGMPKVLTAFHEEMLSSADIAFALYPVLTAGAGLSLAKHGSEALKEKFLTKMYSGQWTASMCLTEAHAGSDLGLIQTKAVLQDDNSYSVTGSKIFITGGEHDLTENIVHLVLAKLPDAPAGPRGISLFLVPKILVNDDQSLGEPNKVSCGAIEHKMGIHASATCVMNFDGAKGYLIGELNKGLACMFTMMNFERIGVGIQGLSAGERSYQNALAYAKDRKQGRALVKNETTKSANNADSIMVHGDVRRMLLNMKALNEGSRALSCYIALQLDYATYGSGELQEKGEALSALMTPLAKAFFTDLGFENTVTGQQVFGGHGYIREWGQEQLVRDARITQIYEGTNGIQAMDLLMRKVVGSQGKLVNIFIDEVRSYLQTVTGDSQLTEFAQPLSQALDDFSQVSSALIKQADVNLNDLGVAANDYLHLFGYTAMAYVWMKMAQSSLQKTTQQDAGQSEIFYQSKVHTARYFFTRLLPRRLSLMATINTRSDCLFNIHDDLF